MNSVGIDRHMTAEVFQETCRTISTTAFSKVKHVVRIVLATSIKPETSCSHLARKARVLHANRRVVRADDLTRNDSRGHQLEQPTDQRRDVHQHPKLRISWDQHPGAGEDVFPTVKRQVIGELVDNDLRVNAEAEITAGYRCRQSTWFFTGGNLCDGVFAFAARSFVTMNFPNEQFGGNQVNSLGDVGTDDRHFFATA